MLNLKEARESKGYTQDQVADFLGVSRPTYTRYEQGTRECSHETLLKLADFFNVTTDYLLGREEKSSTIAAHRTDNPTDDLPKEALDKIEEFKELMRLKYGKK